MTKLGKWLLLLVVACGVYVFFQVDKVMENRTDIISHRVDQINQVIE
jgi:hypothetical protein